MPFRLNAIEVGGLVLAAVFGGIHLTQGGWPRTAANEAEAGEKSAREVDSTAPTLGSSERSYSVSDPHGLAELMSKRNTVFKNHLIEQVKFHMKDPDAAKFRGVEQHGVVIHYADGTRVPYNHSTICGEVNGRNSYGGYVGFRRFVASQDWDEAAHNFKTPTASVMFEDSGEDPTLQRAFDALYSEACRDIPYNKKPG